MNAVSSQVYFRVLTKKDYIQKTQEIIRAEGREAASIRRIAREMGRSTASLYRYFKNQEELIYYAERDQLSGYIRRLNEAEKNWHTIWDYYVGIWDCYCREAFRNPDVFELQFLKPGSEKPTDAIVEYYDMFPEAYEETSESFISMMKQQDFMARDFEVCKKCVAEGAISLEKAMQLNRMVCQMYKGYFKTVQEQKLSEEMIDAEVTRFVEDVDWMVMHLADDLKGYKGYRK